MEALKEMGYNPQVSEKPQNLEGYQGDTRKQTAEIVLPRRQVGGASNDVGFKRQANGTYTLIVSDYDSGSCFGKKKQSQLKQLYAEKKSIKEAKKAGLKFVGKKQVTDQKTGRPVQRLQFVTTR